MYSYNTSNVCIRAYIVKKKKVNTGEPGVRTDQCMTPTPTYIHGDYSVAGLINATSDTQRQSPSDLNRPNPCAAAVLPGIYDQASQTSRTPSPQPPTDERASHHFT